MSLADEYERQFAWRDWPTMVSALPTLDDQLILDLGCGVGMQARALAERGARVIAVDGNEELLAAARARHADVGIEFLRADLRALPTLPTLPTVVDGIWGSFCAAYFVELEVVLRSWAKRLGPGGWIALVEIDDFFAHDPLPAALADDLETFVTEALASGRYDFCMGRKLGEYLRRAGFVVERELSVVDHELAFDGPAAPEVLTAWGQRFDRMATLRARWGSDFAAHRAAFLRCLAAPQHRSRATVRLCLARLPDRDRTG